MDLIKRMQYFARVAECNSFTLAAEQLDVGTGTVSRFVSELEHHLTARLLTRTTRRISLTPAGMRYLAQCQSILEAVNEAEAEARAVHLHPAGCLRVQAWQSLARHYLMPAVKSYREHYPSVQVGLTLSDRPINDLDGDFDIVITACETLRDSSFIGARIGTTHSVLCAAPHYLCERGPIHQVTDLSKQAYVDLAPTWCASVRLDLQGPDGCEEITVNPGLCISSHAEIITALELGMGVGLLPHHLAAEAVRHGRLVHVLPNHRFECASVYALYASKLFLDAKVRTWLEHLKVSFSDISLDHPEGPASISATPTGALHAA